MGYMTIERHETSLYRADDAKQFIIERANNKCEICGKEGTTNNKLLVHHIFSVSNLQRPFNLFNHPSNLQVVCRSCHSLHHGNGRWGDVSKRKGKHKLEV